jgi:predicted SnoaL-like aldol condensation-catalyzing enzyme
MIRAAGLVLAALLTAGCVRPASPRPSSPRAPVDQLYAQVFNGHDLSAAERLLSEDYVQHNPQVPTGRAGFMDAFRGFLSAYPGLRVEVKRVLVDGDLVAVHAHWTLGAGDRGSAVVDIFRVRGGRIVEHWDVVQAVPERAANPNTMF